MLLNIAICDDDLAIGDQIEGFFDEISKRHHLKFKADVFLTGEELCQKLAHGAHYDLIFLDIELSKINLNGIEVGERIRNEFGDHLVSIVYISWNQQYSMKLFDTRPLNFLIKPLTREQIDQAISTHLKVIGHWLISFSYKVGHVSHKVKMKDIVYLESSGREIILYKADGSSAKFYGGLRKIYGEQLEQYGFLAIHSSYVVNFDYITTFEYERLILFDGTILPISQSRRKEIRKAYFDALEGGRK